MADEYDAQQDKLMTSVTSEQFTTESALRVRLDTLPLKFQIRNFLEGKEEKLERVKGRLEPVIRQTSNRMMNDKGIQRIMSYIESKINSQVVQGNTDDEQYQLFMYRTRRDLNRHLFKEMWEYEIREDDYPFICDMLSDMIELFVSRTVKDKERLSYYNWLAHSENAGISQAKQKAGLWQRIGMSAK